MSRLAWQYKAVIALVGVALIAVFGVLAYRTSGGTSGSSAGPTPGADDISTTNDSTSTDISRPTAQSEGAQQVGAPTEPFRSASFLIEQELNDVLAGNARIDDFIRRHLAAARAGNADSMHYVAEAMGYCSVYLSTLMFSLSRQSQESGGPPINNINDIDNIDWSQIHGMVDRELVGYQEYFIARTQQQVTLAEECTSLGMDYQHLFRESRVWRAAAEAAGQPLAVARLVTENLSDKSPGELQAARDTMRNLLQTNRQVELLLLAANLSAATTGKDQDSERLAWLLVGCDYYDCERSFTRPYREACETMALEEGVSYCRSDLSDAEYLERKFPGQLDVARGRAAEIRSALRDSQWGALGLE